MLQNFPFSGVPAGAFLAPAMSDNENKCCRIESMALFWEMIIAHMGNNPDLRLGSIPVGAGGRDNGYSNRVKSAVFSWLHL